MFEKILSGQQRHKNIRNFESWNRSRYLCIGFIFVASVCVSLYTSYFNKKCIVVYLSQTITSNNFFLCWKFISFTETNFLWLQINEIFYLKFKLKSLIKREQQKLKKKKSVTADLMQKPNFKYYNKN